MVKKILIVLVPVLLVLILLAGLGIWYAIGSPLYQPGMVRVRQNLRAPLTPPEQSGDPSTWQVEKDIELHHFSQGTGRPVLVVHGGPGFPPSGPSEALEPLTDEYEFIYYDQRGCGRSSRPFDRFTSPNFYENFKTLEVTLGIGAQLADIERIRRIIGQDRVILLGHSFGGFLAALYAAEFPENVEALVLVAPADLLVFPGEGEDLFEQIRNRLPENMKTEFDGFRDEYFDLGSVFSKSEQDLADLHASFGDYFLAASGADAESIRKPSAEIPNGGWMATAMYFSMGMRHDYRPALAAVQAPVLVIHGENDLQPVSMSRTYVDAFPNASLHVIEDADHFMLEGQGGELAETIGNFLRENR